MSKVPAGAGADDGLARHVGAYVAVTTSTGERFEAELFAYDAASGTAAFRQALDYTTVKSTFRIIRNNLIEKLEYLAAPEMPPVPDSSLPAVNQARLAEKEEEALRAAELKQSHIGSDVSEVAQGVFDALVKTYPCTWDGDTIVVMEEVRIAKPYEPSSCTSSNESALGRIRQVLAAQRSRMAAK